MVGSVWREALPFVLVNGATAGGGRTFGTTANGLGRRRSSCPTGKGERAAGTGTKILRCAQDDESGQRAGGDLPALAATAPLRFA